MVVIVILGGPSTSAAPTTHFLVNPPCLCHNNNNHGHKESGAPYQRIYNRSVSASNANTTRYGHHHRSYHQKTPSHEETLVYVGGGGGDHGPRNKYNKSLSVPQLSLGQRFDTTQSHPSSTTTKATKANQCQRRRDNDEPLIRHITRVNISDASSQLDLAHSNYGAIATTDAEPVTREGEYSCR